MKQRISFLLVIQAILILLSSAFETNVSTYLSSSMATRFFSNASASDWTVASAGDVNGDGFEDMMMGDTLADPFGRENVGMVFVIYGKPGGFPAELDISNLDLSQGFQISGATLEWNGLGSIIGAAGDVNKDGVGDIVLGNPGTLGTVYVIYGKLGGLPAHIDLSTTLNLDQGFQITGFNDVAMIGSEAGAAGDFDGDGVDDIYFRFAEGVYVIFGRQGGLQAHIELDASLDLSKGVRIDMGLSGGNAWLDAGDVNNDGLGDILIGVSQEGDNGAVYVIYGQEDGFQAHIDLTSSSLGDSQGFKISNTIENFRLGYDIRSIGDINKDGLTDFAAVAKILRPQAKSMAYVFYGKQGGHTHIDLNNFDSSQGFVIISSNDLDVGFDLNNAGDVNHDGINEMSFSVYSRELGKRYVCYLYGKQGKYQANITMDLQEGFRYFPGVVISGPEDSMQFVGSGATADVDHDGIPDLLLPVENSASLYGEIYVLYSNGSASWPPASSGNNGGSNGDGGNENEQGNSNANGSEGLSTGMTVVIVLCSVLMLMF